jgi:hypothetical protein
VPKGVGAGGDAGVLVGVVESGGVVRKGVHVVGIWRVDVLGVAILCVF